MKRHSGAGRHRVVIVAVLAGVLVAGASAGVVAAWQPWRAGVVAAWQPWRAGALTAAAEPGGAQPGAASAGGSGAGSAASPQTTRVMRTTLAANLTLSAQLEYSAPVTLFGSGGIVTKLPHAGDLVSTGQALYEVDGKSVVTFNGDRPLWRTLESGVTDGPDIREVEQNLSDLGYGAGLTIDDTFTAATDRAIRAWQKDHGRERTGALLPGDVVMVDSATVRVNTVTAALGGPANAALVSYTDPGIRGRVKLTAAQLTQLVPGMAVTVRLPSGADVPAVIGGVDPGGEATADPSKPTPASAEIDFADQSVLQGLGLPALRVTVGMQHADDALVVPVTALVALGSGGYAVEVPSTVGAAPALVPVTIGLIADSRVQITGGALAEGDDVVVAG